MKNLILTAILVLTLAAMSVAEPNIMIPKQRWDFGHAPQHSALTHDYVIMNTGTDTLNIIRVKPG
ncbi:MAG: hypothetical protein V3W18_11530 [candidate division Zixibacteria bacterium]